MRKSKNFFFVMLVFKLFLEQSKKWDVTNARTAPNFTSSVRLCCVTGPVRI
jgi:hypothetical protein